MANPKKNDGNWRQISDLLEPVIAQDTKTAQRAEVRMQVAQALAADRMTLAYQPVVSAGGARRLAFHEGLLRLPRPDGSVMPAGQFMPLMTSDTLIWALDCAALQLGLTALARDRSLRLAININVRTMHCAEWLALLTLADHDLPGIGFRLIIEITEQVALENTPQVQGFLTSVRGFGCALALDDFGAGATSFRLFREFRFDIVKIDGGFITGLAEDRDRQVLVRALVDIARHFDMLSVAEFVETEADAHKAAELGIDCLQGHLTGYAMARPRRAGFSPLSMVS